MGKAGDQQDVRILLLGDGGVGKTSLVLSLVRESFPAETPALSVEVTIPPDVTPEKVTTHIIDTSSRVQTDDEIDNQIKKASVICVVYALDDPATFQSVSNTWIPRVRQVRGNAARKVPIILVGNKSDAVKDAKTLSSNVLPVMQEFEEAETCVVCSAREMSQISEVFYFAQKAVLYPTAPLYDARERQLTPNARASLSRIFKLCDKDGDGLWDDHELQYYQLYCFGSANPLSPDEIKSVKKLVGESVKDGVRDNAITLDGFLHLIRVFLMRGRQETCWLVLRRFGYSDDLDLKDDYLRPAIAGADDPGRSVELSDAGLVFVTDLFRQHDKEHRGLLNPEQLNELFSVTPGNPWENIAVSPEATTEDPIDMSLERYIALWHLMVAQNYHKACEYLAYLGFCLHHNSSENDSVSAAVQVSRQRRMECKAGFSSRRLFTAFLFGQPECGKSSILDALAVNGARMYDPSTGETSAIARITFRQEEKYLLLREFAVPGMDHEVVQSVVRANRCDVACFVYDRNSPSSFSYVVNLYENLVADPRPQCLFVGSKADLPVVTQDAKEQPAAFCQARRLPGPLAVSTMDPKHGDTAEVFAQIVEMAARPKQRSLVQNGDTIAWLLKMSMLVGVVSVVGYYAFKVWKQGERR